MELTALLNVGAFAAVAAAAFNGMIVLIATRVRGGATYPTAQEQLLTVLLHMAVGIGLGWVFWVSWGFTAIIAVPWWQRGMTFALTVWGVTCVPAIVQLASTRAVPWRTAVGTAAQWLVSIVAVGLACAWSWQRGNF